MTLKRLKIILTFDHELSLGGARSYDQNLFDPTNRLFELAGELDVPLVLFTDVCCAMRFREWDRELFFEPYRRQIAEATELGHDAQLHLHPHWIDSDYREGTFVPASSFSLSAFADREPPNNIRGIVARGVELLEEICRPIRSDYRCVAYRGGGFNLAPQTAQILAALYDCGIRIDSSIAKGICFRTRTNVAEYRNMPAAANWMISIEGPLHIPTANGIMEVPIAARPRTPWNNVPALVGRLLRRKRAYRSSGWGIIGEQSSWRHKLGRLIPRTVWMLTFDSHVHGLDHLLSTLRYHVRQHRDEAEIICSACSHPKLMGNYHRSLMREFVESVRQEYGEVVQFVTFREVYDDVFGCAAGGSRPRA